MPQAFICDYVQTPFGRYAGSLSGVRADDLAAHPIRVLRERNSDVDWDAVEDCILGCANQAGEDTRNIARMASLLAGLPVAVPGTTVNRLCGSGLDAVGTAARAIIAGDGELFIAGGAESMSRAPFVIPKAAEPFARSAEIHDTTIGWRLVNPAMQSAHGTDSIPETAENVAETHGIGRADQDAFALRSQHRTEAARAARFFEREIAPIRAPTPRGHVNVAVDEHPRPDTTVDRLATLKTPFRQPGTVTAGNSSGVNDGAAAMFIASEAAVRRHGLAPRARIVGMATAGVEPRLMGMGPVPAVRKLLYRTNRLLSDVDMIELNEAFAGQSLAVLRSLRLPDDADFVNPHGGAIALGHPLGASGARLAMTLSNALDSTKAKRGIATMCVGVGQGIAVMLERVG